MAIKRKVRRRRKRRSSGMYWVIGLFAAAIALLAFFYQTESASVPQISALAAEVAAPESEPSALPFQPTGGGGGVNPNISTQIVTYEIVGNTAEALRQQMQQKGPSDRNSGKRFDGFTQWTVDWDYHYQKVGGLCQLDRVVASAAVTITLPKWDAVAGTVGLSDRWQTYLEALTLHENGHRDHGIQASHDVLQTLKALPGKASCDELATLADRQAAEIVQNYAQQDIRYDQQTHHGATQGAIFP